MTLAARLRNMFLGIDAAEATFQRRGFTAADAAKQLRLEAVGATFIEGYQAALLTGDRAKLETRLGRVDSEIRGFAFEGAAMALGLIDALAPWRRRVEQLLTGPGDDHAYMVHVGLGWAAARLPWARANLNRFCRGRHHLLRWLVADGYGFHQGYFRAPQFVEKQAEPSQLNGYAQRAFDQGLGRSLWFVFGADVARIARALEQFADSRRADLTSGVGLACAYAGGVERGEIEFLRRVVGDLSDHLAQGAAFAAKARQRAGNPAEHTDLACEILCEADASASAAVTDACMPSSNVEHSDEPAYEVWRRRIRETLAVGREASPGASRPVSMAVKIQRR